MGKKTALIGSVAALGAVGALLAPAAMATPAEQPLWIHVTPASVRAGAEVKVDVRCWAPTFSTTALKIAAHGIDLSGDSDANKVLRFDATVRDLKPGTYQVTVNCLDGPNMTPSGSATASFTILPKAQVPTRPVGAPQTGGGFTAIDLIG